MTEPRNNYRSFWLPDLLGLSLLACLATVPFLSGKLDLYLQSLFHTPAAQTAWSHENRPLWRFLYHFGTWPALITALGGLIVFIASWRRPSLAHFRRHGAYLFLVLAIGPGLLVNTIFKDHWGRPRPRQVTEFGGRWQFQHVLQNGAAGRGKSFPCGHSSTGYYFVALYFLLRRRHKKLSLAALAGALLYGTLIGIARMAAGAHFFSDVLWSAVFTAGAACLLYYFILRIPATEDTPGAIAPARRPALIITVSILLAAGALLATLAATPSYRDWHTRISIPESITPDLEIKCLRCDVDLSFIDSPDRTVQVAGEAHGFGWPWIRIRESFSLPDPPGTTLRLAVIPDKGFSELAGSLRIRVPARLFKEVRAEMTENQIKITAPPGLLIPPLNLRMQQAIVSAPEEMKRRLLEEPATNGVQILRLPATR